MAKKLVLAGGVVELSLRWVTGVLAGFAQREGGKTYLAARLAEELVTAGAQTIILDIMGNYFGLCLSKDGRAAGLPFVVFGGLNPHVPLVAEGRTREELEATGRAVAQAVVRRKLSAIIDVSQFPMEAMYVFVAAFCEELYALKARNRGPLHLLIDEIHEFAPSVLEEEGQKRLRSAVTRIVRNGRTFGLGCSMWDQRPQDVHPKVRGQIELLFAGLCQGDLEKEAIAKKVREWGPSMLASLDRLATLSTGDFLAFHPKLFHPPVPMRADPRRTFDTSSTPEFGGEAVSFSTLPPVDAAALGAELSALIAEAAEEEPKVLRRNLGEYVAFTDAAGWVANRVFIFAHETVVFYGTILILRKVRGEPLANVPSGGMAQHLEGLGMDEIAHLSRAFEGPPVVLGKAEMLENGP